MCPPRALVTASTRRGMDWIRLRITFCGISFHALSTTAHSSSTFCIGVWIRRTALPRTSHRFSIGDKSREQSGHGSTGILCWLKKVNTLLATWGLALSCWNMASGWTWICGAFLVLGSRQCIADYLKCRINELGEISNCMKLLPTP